MASDAREKLRATFKETNGAVSRLVPSLFVMCMSAVILGGTDDKVLLTSGKVVTPFVGQTRYEIFMVLAPLSIVGLRLYVDMQLAYLERIIAIADRFRVARPIGISAANNRVLLIAGATAVHLVPPVSVAFLGRHVSAIYPIYGLSLYAVAGALVLWSVWRLLSRRDLRQAAVNFVTIAAVAGVAGIMVSAGLTSGGVLGANQICDRRYEGFGAQATAGVLRQIDLERLDFTGLSASERNLSCGAMSETTWTHADLRETRLWGADLNGAVFTDADLAQAEFSRASLRRARLDGAQGWSTLFHEADLDGVVFDQAALEEARLNAAFIDKASFIRSRLRYASLYKSEGFDVAFTEADLTDAKLHFARLYDASFRGARLLRADFFGASLIGADFAGADLTCASFEGATLENVDFSGVSPAALMRMDYAPESETGIVWPAGFDRRDAGAAFAEDGDCERR